MACVRENRKKCSILKIYLRQDYEEGSNVHGMRANVSISYFECNRDLLCGCDEVIVPFFHFCIETMNYLLLGSGEKKFFLSYISE